MTTQTIIEMESTRQATTAGNNTVPTVLQAAQPIPTIVITETVPLLPTIQETNAGTSTTMETDTVLPNQSMIDKITTTGNTEKNGDDASSATTFKSTRSRQSTGTDAFNNSNVLLNARETGVSSTRTRELNRTSTSTRTQQSTSTSTRTLTGGTNAKTGTVMVQPTAERAPAAAAVGNDNEGLPRKKQKAQPLPVLPNTRHREQSNKRQLRDRNQKRYD
jgi:hypothetical protein